MAQDQNPKLGRVGIIYGMVFLSLSSLILRMGYLQIAQGETFRKQANTTMLAQMPVLPSRGRIYDTNGVLLAYDQPSFSIEYTRLNSPQQDPKKLSDSLAPILGMSSAALLNIINTKDKGQTQISLFDNATPEQVSYVDEHQSSLPGVQVTVVPKRAYKYGDLAGHILGFVGKITGQDQAYYTKLKYNMDQWVGKDGVEKYYESLLQGTVGARVVEVNSAGVPLKDFGLNPPPQDGKNLQLTIDAQLQAQAQQIVVNELAQVRKLYHYDPKDAEVVMLDPKTGGVLAMVSYPYYNPSWFVTSNSYLLHQNYIWNSVLTPTLNHDLASYRYPGSTVKPANILAALETGVIKPNTTIQDKGYEWVGSYFAKNWTYPATQGLVDPAKAIQVSCDTYMYDVGMWLANWYGAPKNGESIAKWVITDHVKGLNTLFHWESLFGLGELTGIDLPGEQKGQFYQDKALPGQPAVTVPYDLQAAMKAIATKGYYQNYGLLYDNAFAAIGQEQQFTPMELAQYVMTIADNGVKLQPHVLKEVYPAGVTPGTGAGQPFQTVVQSKIKLNPAYLKVVQQGMYDVCNVWPGTAFSSFVGAPYKAAGKTGTAQVGNGKRDISLFIAYAPVNDPQVAMAIMVPGGGESGQTAVPMGRELFDAYFKEHGEFYPKSDVGVQLLAHWSSTDASKIPETMDLTKPKLG